MDGRRIFASCEYDKVGSVIARGPTAPVEQQDIEELISEIRRTNKVLEETLATLKEILEELSTETAWEY